MKKKKRKLEEEDGGMQEYKFVKTEDGDKILIQSE